MISVGRPVLAVRPTGAALLWAPSALLVAVVAAHVTWAIAVPLVLCVVVAVAVEALHRTGVGDVPHPALADTAATGACPARAHRAYHLRVYGLSRRRFLAIQCVLCATATVAATSPPLTLFDWSQGLSLLLFDGATIAFWWGAFTPTAVRWAAETCAEELSDPAGSPASRGPAALSRPIEF